MLSYYRSHRCVFRCGAALHAARVVQATVSSFPGSPGAALPSVLLALVEHVKTLAAYPGQPPPWQKKIVRSAALSPSARLDLCFLEPPRG